MRGRRHLIAIAVATMMAAAEFGTVAAQQSASGEWDACLKTPKRACILDHALQIAAAIKNANARISLLTEIAEAQIKAGLKNEAQASIDQALKLASSIAEPTFRTITLAQIAQSQAKAGSAKDAKSTFDHALQLAKSLPIAGNNRDAALQTIISLQASAGMFSEALKVTASITYGNNRTRALAEIAEAQAKAGLANEAKATFDQALQLARSIKLTALSTTLRAELLADIAKAQAKAGFEKESINTFDQSFAMARSFKEEWERQLIWQHLAQALAGAGNFSRALEVTQFVTNIWNRTIYLNEIAEAQAKAGPVEEAEAKATFQRALQVAQSLAYASRREAFLAIAEAQAGVGLADEAKATFDRGLRFAAAPSDDWRYNSAVGSIVTALANADKSDDAQRFAQSIADGGARAAALVLITIAQAKVQANAGKYAEALQLAQSITNGEVRASALVSIAMVLSR